MSLAGELQRRTVRFGWVLYLAGMALLFVCSLGIILWPWMPEKVPVGTLLQVVTVGLGMALLGRDFRRHGY
jgi:hypothetical protein